jgi:lipopolysaccharide biosynthesis glycosyltransferase
MPIDCVLCFRDESGTYFINAYVTLVSIFANTKEKILVHIIHDDTLEQGKKYLEKLCHDHGHDINFHKVPEDSFDAQTTAELTKKFNIGITYRYYIHEFVKAEKAIYLDCDVIVNRDIRDLYAIPLGDKLLAATLDWEPWVKGRLLRKYQQVQKTIKYLQLQQETYINSGVLLLNLDKLRKLSGDSNIFVRKTQATINDGIELFYPDQDIINSVAAIEPDSVLVLEENFNRFSKSFLLGIDCLQGTIFHFTTKPSKSFLPAHLLFWKYYAMTPFAADMCERISATFCSMDLVVDFMQEYCRHPRHRRHAVELLRYGMAGMLLRAVGRLLGLLKK